jgi:hypothetical protein
VLPEVVIDSYSCCAVVVTSFVLNSNYQSVAIVNDKHAAYTKLIVMEPIKNNNDRVLKYVEQSVTLGSM